ncbi:hypothetical protein C1645_692024 [Glomus cerebriforme]|uniref:Crinkler effector protein N-terminal domain-containing protein n=1 Tax=Glomus cerebriforme TaxID=658196 RepID=A0A397T0Q2_9GLOM|nr:hypothetical protein C1645_692024 [Glomus cerebriforme]
MSDKFKTSDNNCLISGERVNDIFDVTISNANNNRVFSLMETIKTYRPDQFQDINLTSLDLYKAGMLSNSIIIHNSSNSSALKIEDTTRIVL